MAQEVRKLTIDDYDALIKVWADAGLPYRPFGRDSRERMEIEMQREDTEFIGLFLNGRLVALGLVTYDGRKGWINRVAVDPDYRNQGFASRIIEESERFLHGLGAEIIACLIEEYNTPSMALFQKHGYLYGEDIHYFSKRKSEDT